MRILLLSILFTAQVYAGAEQTIQAALDGPQHGCVLAPGETVIEAPLRITSRMKLTGSPLGSWLTLKSSTFMYAVMVQGSGELDTLYDVVLDNFGVQGGGVWLLRSSPSLRISRLTIDGAPLNGLYVKGHGDGMTIRDVTVRNAKVAGVRIDCYNANNNITFDGVEVSGCKGGSFLFRTFGAAAHLDNLTLRDCVGQGSPSEAPEFAFLGAGDNIMLDHCWFERTKLGVGVYLGANEDGRLPVNLTALGVRVANAPTLTISLFAETAGPVTLISSRFDTSMKVAQKIVVMP